MRISTSQVFLRGLNGVLAEQSKLLKLQQQLSSQKKLETPSDDPISAAQIDQMKLTMNFTNGMQKNLEAAVNELGYEESMLANVIDVVQSLRTLQVQAANSSYSLSDRQAMAVSAQNLLNQLQNLANAQDSNNDYIFGGSQTTTTPITLNASGQYVYNGDETQRYQQVSRGVQIAVNDNANDIFMRIPNGNGTFTVSQSSSNTGNASSSSGSVVDAAAYIADNYTVSFTTNSQGELVVMVGGATTGPIIPTTGLPNDAPLYQRDSAINFQGIQITVYGTPEPGDSFEVSPSQNESIFSTIQRMITNLNRSFDTATEKATVQTENDQIMDQLDNALVNILGYEAQVGSRLNELDVADKINQDVIFISQETLVDVQDVNLAEVAVSLNLEQVYLQAAQQSFARIQGLSLFNYI